MSPDTGDTAGSLHWAILKGVAEWLDDVRAVYRIRNLYTTPQGHATASLQYLDGEHAEVTITADNEGIHLILDRTARRVPPVSYTVPYEDPKMLDRIGQAMANLIRY